MPRIPSQAPKHRTSFMCLAEEREHSTLLDVLAQNPAQAPGLERWHHKPPPTFPFLESQCQRAPPEAKFHFARNGTPLASKVPASGVGAGYMRQVLPCQTQIAIYFPRLWTAEILGNRTGRSRTHGVSRTSKVLLPIDAGPRGGPSRLT